MRVLYYLSTAVLALMMLASAVNYFVDPATFADRFANLGYPGYLPIPLGVAKVLGVFVLWAWAGIPIPLRQLAYAGFLFNLLLAAAAHIAVGDVSGIVLPAVGIVSLGVSYWTASRSERIVPPVTTVAA